ncbi:glycosyltransferase [Geovibrio thiophilus]|uniref:Glycosyltransferase n=1 Tax=Geovibrio thiophilus TaxID=139438 RepID=A0A3R5UZD4_9BACT|nr:WecB/TagA/CpsF family glycosyltransferase [Geovibrio thiophilus]QAR34184.1 glycosyltransferase [Geovibrio thiophilus]
MEILGYNVFDEGITSIGSNEKRQIINTINPHSYIIATKDKVFTQALQESDILLPDGSGIVFAASFLKKRKIRKISGFDLHKYLLEEMNKIDGRVFYLGASEKCLELIKKRIDKEYPKIEVGVYSPLYKAQFSESDNLLMIEKVNEFKPNILFIGMTAPKQEKWLHIHKDKLFFSTACSVGAVFDFYAGLVKRPSNFWIKLHLEWLIRFLKEPKRLWERNLVSTPLFVYAVVKEKVKIMRER